MKLVYKYTNKPVLVGDTVKVWGNPACVDDFQPPDKPDSAGKVKVTFLLTGEKWEFYVTIIGAEWVEREDRGVNLIKLDLERKELFADIDVIEGHVAGLWKRISAWQVAQGQLGEASRQGSIARTELEGGFQRLRRAVAGEASPWTSGRAE